MLLLTTFMITSVLKLSPSAPKTVGDMLPASSAAIRSLLQAQKQPLNLSRLIILTALKTLKLASAK